MNGNMEVYECDAQNSELLIEYKQRTSFSPATNTTDDAEYKVKCMPVLKATANYCCIIKTCTQSKR